MKKEVISKKQAISMFILFSFGSNSILGTGSFAGKDAYISIIISMVISLPLIIIYYKTCELFPDKNLYQIITLVFGKFLGKIIIILYIWFTFHLASILLIITMDFLNTIGLFYTPKVIVGITFCLLIAWGLKEGIETLGRWSEFIIIIIIMYLILVPISSISIFNFDNIKPILLSNIDKLPKSILVTISYPFSQYFLFISFNDSFDKKQNIKKIFLYSLLISGFFMSYSMLVVALQLCEYKIKSFYYILYEAIKLVKVSNVFERIEIIISANFLFVIFIKISLSLLSTLKGIKTLFNLDDYRYLIIPVVALTLNMSLILYQSNMELVEFALNIYPYYSIPFQIIFPIILFIVAKIKKT